jgi:hypothetical protein
MKRTLLICLCVILLASGCSNGEKTPTAIEPWYPAANENGDPVFAVFEGFLPCSDCTRIKFSLVLYAEGQTNTPSTYMVARVYVAKGDDRTVNEGAWTITQGTGLDPAAVVYQLDSNAPEEFRSFWTIGQDILFILDQDMNPRVGDGGYSYALNKTR